MTKKLRKLLYKYKKANRARLTAYARRSRLLNGVVIQQEDATGNTVWTRIFKVPVTDELKAQLDADINTARLHKLEVSAELRAYCKKKKYHLSWGSSNNIIAVRSHQGWLMRKEPARTFAVKFFAMLRDLKLTTRVTNLY